MQLRGHDWWPKVWGERYDPSLPVLRVEFEIGRQGLAEYQVESPSEGLEAAPRLWASVTSKWLRYWIRVAPS